MSNYDGEIKIDTKIRTADAEQKLLNLQNHMVKTANKVEKITQKMKQMENAKVPTEEYKSLQKELDSANKEAEKLGNTVAKLSEKGTYSDAFKNAKLEYMEMRNSADQIEQQMNQMVTNGTAYKDLKSSNQYKILANDLKVYNSDLELSALKEQKLKNELIKIEEAGGKAFNAIGKSANKTGSFIKTLASRFKGIMLSLLIFNWISKGWNAMISGMKDGFQNLAKYSEEYNRSVSSLKSANAELKNNLAAAFAPIVQMAIPYLVKLIGWINTAANAISKFFAALQGKTTYTKAVKQNIDYAASIKEVGDSAKKTAKSLAAYDELNVMQKNDESSSSSGNGGEITGANAFEEEEIDSKFLAMVEKVKEVLQTIAPLVVFIGAALLAWKVAEFLTSLMEINPLLGKIVGALAIIAGTALAIYNYIKMWQEGVDWSNIIGYVTGVAVAVGALYALFGPVAAGIALIVAGAAGLILSLKDIAENGLTTENMALLLISSFGILTGVFVVFGGTAALIVGIIMTVIGVLATLVVYGGNGEEALGHLKDAFKALGDFVKKIFTGDMEGAFESLKKAGKSFGNFFISVAEGIANGFIKMVNAVIDSINKISFDVPDWLESITGMKTFGFNIPHWDAHLTLPRLANGGVTTGSTLANIGEAGREAVIPLERNTEWMNTFAEMLAGKMGNTGAGTIDLTVNLDGNVVYKRIVQLDREFAGRTGSSQFVY